MNVERDKNGKMFYSTAISIALYGMDDNEHFSDEEKIEAIEKILSMETINATPKQALLNIVRWFFDKCVEEVKE